MPVNRFKEHLQHMESLVPAARKILQIRPALDPEICTCPACHQAVVPQALMDNRYLCPWCGHHFPISARERIRQICDPFSFQEMDARVQTYNEVSFPDYEVKLRKARQNTGMNEAVICGVGRIQGRPAAIGVMDGRFMMASMGMSVGEKITRLIEKARNERLPLILFCASGGARMQEGMYSLMQMAKTSAALKAFSDQGGLYISVLTHPTTGGVSASFAMLADIILAEPKALIGFAGRRVIEKTIRQTLPETFQSAEFVQDHGFVDAIVSRDQLKNRLAWLLKMHEVKP